MKAVDTNVLARFFIVDPEDAEASRQHPAAVSALSVGGLFVPLSVVLEFEWVMRGFYKLTAAQVSRVLHALCDMQGVTVESRDDKVLPALAAHAAGMDFADALHCAGSSHCSALVTFDRGLARRAKRREIAPEVELLR